MSKTTRFINKMNYYYFMFTSKDPFDWKEIGGMKIIIFGVV